MRVWFFPALIGCLVMLGGIANAQSPEERDSSPFESIIPAYLADVSGRVKLASDSTETRSSVDVLPNPLIASPPSEPDAPDWGEYSAPRVTPVYTPAIEYSLIGPPRGYLQHSEDQDYRAVISDPESLLAYDRQVGQCVNIFRPDGIAPVGVFGDHTLPTGTTFVSYRYLQNSFDQNYDGSHRIGVPTSFGLAPRRMMQNSQVALVEYGATQDFTFLAYLPFQRNEIDFQTATGTAKAGYTNPGDIRLMGLYVLTRGQGSQSHVNFGLSLPVGFLETQTTIGVTPTAIPYPLRTSSGTYDLLLGYTYRKQTDNWTWGGQVNAVIPTGLNTLNYEVGNQLQLTSWISRRWTERWSTSARLDGRLIENIHGADVRLDPTLTPVNRTNAQGSRSLNGLLGVNYLLSRPGHRIQEQRLFLEAGVPLYQWVDGPQLGLSWTLNAGWGMAF